MHRDGGRNGETMEQIDTDGKQLYSCISKTLGGADDIILRLSIRDQDSDFRNVCPGARLGLKAVLEDVH